MVTIGNPAPNSTWSVAWQNGIAAPAGSNISLADYLGKVVVLLLAEKEH